MTDLCDVSSITYFDEDSNESVMSVRSTSTDRTCSGSEIESTCTTEDEGDDESPWSAIEDKALACHEEELENLVHELQENGHTLESAEAQPHNRMLPVYRKEVRNILLNKLEWMHEMKKDPYYRKIMKTRQDLMDINGYDWMEATEAAIHRRKFLLNKLSNEQEIPSKEGKDFNWRAPDNEKKKIVRFSTLLKK